MRGLSPSTKEVCGEKVPMFHEQLIIFKKRGTYVNDKP